MEEYGWSLGFLLECIFFDVPAHRAKVGFYGEDVRQMHTKSVHEACALRGFSVKLRLFTSILVSVKKVFI